MESYDKIIDLLKSLIQTPSYSREEELTAELLEDFFKQEGIPTNRIGNNIWVKNRSFDINKPSILLNSHHDTVKPNSNYTLNPFEAIETDGKLYGLGSNDAGGCLVSLIATFLHFYDLKHLNYNLIFAASAEEEVSGKNGMERLLKVLSPIDFAIVGEPTQMRLATAEKGLMVLDCTSYGKAGHAAHKEGDNAIYKALPDIDWFRNFKFPKLSQALGPMQMNVTMIESGQQHNVVPEICKFVVDVRTTDAYSNEETLRIIKEHVGCKVEARSTRLNSSGIEHDHPIVVASQKLKIESYGSPTMSDQALMPFPSVKIGPGDSARSHAANEFIYLEEIKEGIGAYIMLLQNLPITNNQ